MLDGDMVKAESLFFRALGNETRIRILKLLHDRKELNVTEISDNLNKEQYGISHHLSCLKNCGLVATRREGKYVYYSLNGRKRISTILDLGNTHVKERLEDILTCDVVRDD